MHSFLKSAVLIDLVKMKTTEKKIERPQRRAANKKNPYPHPTTKNPDKPAIRNNVAPDIPTIVAGFWRIDLAEVVIMRAEVWAVGRIPLGG